MLQGFFRQARDLFFQASSSIFLLTSDKLNPWVKTDISILAYLIIFLLTNISKVPVDKKQAVINNAGGHANHSLFWKILTPSSTNPEGDLLDKIRTPPDLLLLDLDMDYLKTPLDIINKLKISYPSLKIATLSHQANKPLLIHLGKTLK